MNSTTQHAQNPQHQIYQTLRRNLQKLLEIVERHSFYATRTAITRFVCEEFGFRTAAGKLQESTCYNALCKLEKRGEIKLPESRETTPRVKAKPVCLERPVALPMNLPERAENIKGLEVILVDSKELLKIWNTLVVQEHPLSFNKTFGSGFKYLINSENGILGAIGFGSAAEHLVNRDMFIGWSDEIRGLHLNKVVSMSRFLIRPSVKCKNLASRVLSLCVKRFVEDFKNEYNFSPMLLETFVEHDQTGGCYKAANWIFLGYTAGLGRDGKLSGTIEDQKQIYVYPLNNNFREGLGVEDFDNNIDINDIIKNRPLKEGENYKKEITKITDGLELDNWVENEFLGCDLGSKTRNTNYLLLVKTMFSNPKASLAEAVGGDKKLLDKFYYLLDNEKEDVNIDSMMHIHTENTIARINLEKTVIYAVDGLVINEDQVKCAKDELGDIGKSGNNIIKGFKSTNILALNTKGITLGVLKSSIDTPKFLTEEEKEYRKRVKYDIPLEEKKTFVWIRKIRWLAEFSEGTQNVQHVYVADRENDNYDIFFELSNSKRLDYVIRASYNRKVYILGGNTKQENKVFLFDYLYNKKDFITTNIDIPKDNNGNKARKANVKIVCEKVCIPPSKYTPDEPYIIANVVMVKEEEAPEGYEPIEWILYSSLSINTWEDALTIIGYYKKRWRIEEWHKVCKSMCGIDELRSRKVERMKRQIAIKMIIAWYIMFVTLLGREYPELPGNVIFSEQEMDILKEYATYKNGSISNTLGDMTTQVARIGGYVDNNEENPGNETTCKGIAILQTILSAGMIYGKLIENALSSYFDEMNNYNIINIDVDAIKNAIFLITYKITGFTSGIT